MSDIIIAADHLSKRYVVGHRSAERERYTALRDVLAREARSFARKAVDFARGRQIVQGDEIDQFWALKDVSFEIKRGDVVGVIGRNGAGKSTLLKILSRVTEPTEGRVTLRGRIASLLEVGTGFHPELSGRENIFLNGSILGMTRREIRRKFDEIVAFAGVERFLDTPVKRYSSGMYVRLAFAVAAHLEPEILVIDEVLAVGDAEFQRKCLGKMDDVARNEGRTVIIVSHNMGLVNGLCSSALLLDNGTLRLQDSARVAIDEYFRENEASPDPIITLSVKPRPNFVQDEKIRITSLEWLTELPLQHGQAAAARISFDAKMPVMSVVFTLGFSNIEGHRVVTYSSDYTSKVRPDVIAAGSYSVEMSIPSLPLQAETYDVAIGARSGDAHVLDYISGDVRIEVISGPRTPAFMTQKFPTARLESDWSWKVG